MRMRAWVVALVVMVVGGVCSVADAAGVTPGWECVPVTAGQAVKSGGTGSSPSCGSGTTAVLAPTYVSSGVDGQPTVEFSGVNVQIVDGSGSTSSVNGSGNLVLGYDESPGTQSGSHDLILGEGQDYTGYGDLVAGRGSTVTGDYAASFGENNQAPGSDALVAGDANVASGAAASAMGGYENHASSADAAVLGGCGNIAGSGTVSVASSCTNQSSNAGDYASISGGVGNQTSG